MSTKVFVFLAHAVTKSRGIPVRHDLEGDMMALTTIAICELVKRRLDDAKRQIQMQTVQTRIKYEECPLCGSKEFKGFFRTDCSRHPLYHPAISPEMTWCKCSICGHVFTDGYFTSEAADLVFSKTNESQRVGFDLEKQRYVSSTMIEKILPYFESGNWLDIGFGNASLLYTAEEYGFTPVGVDLRRDNVAALASSGIEAHCVDIVDFKEQSGRFSVVSMADVLEHMPFPGQALKAVHSLLHDDGVLFVSMPNSDSALWRGLNNHNANPYWSELEHYHNFGRRSLYKLLEESGFVPVRFGISQRYRVCMEVIARKAS